MSFKVIEGVVACEYRGPLYWEALLEAARQIDEFCGPIGCHRVVIDLTESQGSLSTSERFLLGSKLIGVWTPEVHAAILVRPDQMEADQFFETVVTPRGLKLRLFTDAAQARAWLESGSAAPAPPAESSASP